MKRLITPVTFALMVVVILWAVLNPVAVTRLVAASAADVAVVAADLIDQILGTDSGIIPGTEGVGVLPGTTSEGLPEVIPKWGHRAGAGPDSDLVAYLEQRQSYMNVANATGQSSLGDPLKALLINQMAVEVALIDTPTEVSQLSTLTLGWLANMSSQYLCSQVAHETGCAELVASDTSALRTRMGAQLLAAYTATGWEPSDDYLASLWPPEYEPLRSLLEAAAPTTTGA